MLNQRPYTLDNPLLRERAEAILAYAETGGRSVPQLLKLASTLWGLSLRDKDKILQMVGLHVLAGEVVKSHDAKIQASDSKTPGQAGR